MAYIKKLKNNELIGGTDNTDVYPVTSTEAVYNRENVSQEYINNHVDGSKIVDGTVTTGKIANNAVTMGKLGNEVQTLIQQGADSSWTPKGDFNIETTYDANDVVFDPVTNSSYLSLRADNTGHPVDENDEEYEEGWWMKVLDGSYVNRAIEEMEAAIAQAIEDAQEDIDDAIAGANTAAQAATDAAGAATTAKNTLVTEISQSLAVYETVADTIVTDPEAATGMLPVQNYVLGRTIDPLNKAADYIKGDVRILAVGQVYALDEAVKTSDDVMLRIVKEVKTMNTADTVATGDLKVANNKTYKALYPISAYSSSADYSTHPYAIGRPAGAKIEVTVDSEVVAALTEAVDITVTIVDVDCTVSVDTESTAVSIAADILTAFGTRSEWNLTDNEDGTLTLVSKVAKSTAPTISSSVGESGVTIAFVADSAYAGATTTSKITEDVWGPASVDDMYGDSSLYEEVPIADLTSDYTAQNSVSLDIENKAYNNVVVDLPKGDVFGGYVTSSNTWTTTGSGTTTFIPIIKNVKYIISAISSQQIYAVLKSIPPISGSVQYADGYSGRRTIAMGESEAIYINTDDAKYFAFRTDGTSGSVFAPQVNYLLSARQSIKEIENAISDIDENLYYKQEINLVSQTYYGLVITAYNVWGTSTVGRNHFRIPVVAGQRYKIVKKTATTYYAFLKSQSCSSGGTPDYSVGYEQRYTCPSSVTIIIPEDCNYLYIQRTNTSVVTIPTLFQLLNINEAGITELKEEVYSNGTYYYYGERVILTEKPMYKHSIWWDMSQNKCQSAAAFGNYLFKVQDFNDSNPRIVMYNLSTKLQVAIKEMAHRSEGWVHCNQSSFGTQYYDENDPFPLLYISQQEINEDGNTASWSTSKNKNMRSVCEVYRLIPTMGENDYNALDVVKVQTIYLPVITATNGLGRMNIGFDLQNNLMYAQSRDIATGDSNNYGLSYISLFKSIPSLRDNSDNIVENVYLAEADVRYTFPIYELGGDAQGNCIYNGKMYIARGSAAARAQLYIVNLVTKKFLARLDLGVNGFNYEPEGVFIYDDNLYIVNVKVSLIELK